MLHTQGDPNHNHTLQKICNLHNPNHLNKNALRIDLAPPYSNRNDATLVPTDRPQTLRSSFQQEIPLLFVQICLMVQDLSDMRIVQKLARPIERENKLRLVNQVNQVLQKVQLKLNFIKQKSAKFSKSKGEPITISYEKSSILIEQEIYPSKWKDGLRKTQVKINSFYKERLNMFQKVNQALGERFIIKKIDIDDWLKECMKKMKGFCLCG